MKREGERAGNPKETIILVHGLWMTGLEMRLLGRRLERGGFNVRYFRYPSWTGRLEDAAQGLHKEVEDAEGARVHLLGHSLGGIVIAKMLESSPPARVGSIALVGSPIRGSAMARRFARNRFGRLLIGPVACEGIVENIQASFGGRRLLIVAGTLPLGAGVLFRLSRPHDGVVRTAETQVEGAETLVLRASHLGMLLSARVARSLGDFFSR